MDTLQVKQRFGIIGSSASLDRAINTAVRVASTDLSVLITGESGTGKEVMPQIIHQLSSRKHGAYIAVNCGAIPEGTIDSELFGHEKGSFTGASGDRKGYFEVANGGTIFLDEVAELPVQTQVRLLRVLETGEFMKVGSSKVIKTDVRVVAATNVNIPVAIEKEKFREDLYYRLNTVPIQIPSLRERKDDIHLLFRKFAADFAEKYRMPAVRLDEVAQQALTAYRFPGNIRQLKNIAEQISIIETERSISAEMLVKYLPDNNSKVPILFNKDSSSDMNEREILYKVLFDMKKDVTELKKLVASIMQNPGAASTDDQSRMLQQLSSDDVTFNADRTIHLSSGLNENSPAVIPSESQQYYPNNNYQEPAEVVEESLSIEEKEKELIKKALEKYRGKRKYAAEELGISERTLYRKIKEYKIK
jgi:transcriptional regulator with PAS, ATPase and Fis domain